MTNFQVYKKTLSFSFLNFLVDLLGLGVVGGAATAGFFIVNNGSNSRGFVGLVIGLLIGCLLLLPISIFLSNPIKAGQISMMTKGVTEDALPDHPFNAGMKEARSRFGSITAFYLISSAIKGVFNQLGRTINRIGTAIGGNVGNGITSAIDSAIQTLIAYLCDCCLGWIMFRKDENAFKAGCEGAVIFFKHGKTLIRNVGRIFGMGFLSLVLIGGGFFGIGYAIFSQFPGMFEVLVKEAYEIAATDGGVPPEVFQNPTTYMLIVLAIGAVVLWGILHSVLARPFILVGVLRNFMVAGQKDIPTEQDFVELDNKSPKFAKLHRKFQEK